MQFYSFDLKDPLIEIANWTFSFQIITLENIYGLDLDTLDIQEMDSGWTITCSQLRWAGQQRVADGTFEATILRDTNDGLRVTMTATAPHDIRAVKLIVRKLPAVKLLNALYEPREVPTGGLLDRYPNDARLPLWLAQLPDGTLLGARCEDPQVRAKRIAIYQERMGTLTGQYAVECLHEEDARHFSTSITTPTWVLEHDTDAQEFLDDQLVFAESALRLVRWEQRTDMPSWTQDITLCLTLHGMHWSGYVFNTYDQMLEIIRFAAQRLEGPHILAYLPGWEGRYYWQAGDYRPDPLLGGHEGFVRLCEGANALGVHVMPMFAATCANAYADNFADFGPASMMKSPTRNPFLGNQPDWDLSRARDTGWQAWLNVGAEGWQNELVRQIGGLVEQYGFDGVFLDCSEVWVNDPDANLLEGFRELVVRLRDQRDDLLVTGEDWWDGLLGVFPIFQKSAYGKPVPDWTSRYARIIAHIQDSEPSRGSTGVFESGYEPYQPLPNRDPFITTIAFTDGTLDHARPEVEAAIEQACVNAEQKTSPR